MKLVRFGPAGKEKPGIIDSNGKIRDLSKVVKDIDAEALSPAGLAKIRKANIDKLPKVAGNVGHDLRQVADAALRIEHAGFFPAECAVADKLHQNSPG